MRLDSFSFQVIPFVELCSLHLEAYVGVDSFNLEAHAELRSFSPQALGLCSLYLFEIVLNCAFLHPASTQTSKMKTAHFQTNLDKKSTIIP